MAEWAHTVGSVCWAVPVVEIKARRQEEHLKTKGCSLWLERSGRKQVMGAWGGQEGESSKSLSGDVKGADFYHKDNVK